MSPDDDDSLDAYIKFASQSRGIPDEFEDWVIDSGKKLAAKKKIEKGLPDDNAQL